MRQSSDIAGVTVLLSRQLQELGLEYCTCSFNVIDDEAALSHLYAVGPSEQIRLMPVASIGASQLDVITECIGVVGAPVFVPDIVEGFDFAYAAEDLQGSPVLEERDLPPLRERREDIPLLADHFLRRRVAELGLATSGFTAEAMDALSRFDWPGNVRELENEIQRALVMAPDDGDIPFEMLSERIRKGGQ